MSARCQLMSSFSSRSTPKSFLAGLLWICSSPSLYWYQGLPQPRCSTLPLALLKPHEFHMGPLLRLVQVASCPSGVLKGLLSLVSPADLLRMHSTPSSMSLMKMTVTLVPVWTPERHHLSLVYIGTLSCWPLACRCDHPTNFLPIKQPTHCIHLSNLEVLWGTVSKAENYRNWDKWHLWPFPCPLVESLHHWRLLGCSEGTCPWWSCAGCPWSPPCPPRALA